MRARQDPDNPGRLRIEFGGLFTEDLAGSRLQIHPESAIQPRSQQAFEAFELKIITGVGAALADQPVSICPELDIPLGPLDGQVTLRLQRADVAAAPTQDGGTLMVGMLIGKDPQPEPGTGSPSRLRVSPFATPTGNVFVRAHEALLNKLAAESVPLVEQFIQDKIDARRREVREPLRPRPRSTSSTWTST